MCTRNFCARRPASLWQSRTFTFLYKCSWVSLTPDTCLPSPRSFGMMRSPSLPATASLVSPRRIMVRAPPRSSASWCSTRSSSVTSTEMISWTTRTARTTPFGRRCVTARNASLPREPMPFGRSRTPRSPSPPPVVLRIQERRRTTFPSTSPCTFHASWLSVLPSRLKITSRPCIGGAQARWSCSGPLSRLLRSLITSSWAFWHLSSYWHASSRLVSGMHCG
mmetsp:Transcript_9039/g.15282  ORF Transcript_9039/g.15282 Transcript_9039/m.15282 type:complete len:222 (+) Transcript_9039:2467-3132(+)